MIEYPYACRQSVSNFFRRVRFGVRFICRDGRSNSSQITCFPVSFNEICRLYMLSVSNPIDCKRQLYFFSFFFKVKIWFQNRRARERREREVQWKHVLPMIRVLGWRGGYVSDPRLAIDANNMSGEKSSHLGAHLSLFADGMVVGWENVQPTRVQFDPYLQAWKKKSLF